MKFREYIEQTHAFTIDQMAGACDLSPASVKTTLRRAIRSGQIERVRRGAYVSKVGRFSTSGIDAFELASAIDESAIFSFHSALEAHGVAHNVSSVCQFRSAVVKTPFEYSGTSYRPYPSMPAVPTQVIRGRGALRTIATTREQTIVDCLEHPDRAGGVEEALVSLSLFPYIDAEELEALVSNRSASLAARVGWLLEQKSKSWRVSEEVLERFQSMAAGGPFRLDKDAGKSLGWSNRWRLCLPDGEEEVGRWVI